MPPPRRSTKTKPSEGELEPEDEAAPEEEASPNGTAPVAPPEIIVVFKRWPTIVCAVLAAVGFAGTGYFGRYWLNDRSTSNQDNQVRAAVTRLDLALTNFNAGNVDHQFATIQSLATGAFATQARQFFGSSIRNQLISAGAGSRGQVRELYIESLGGGQASVFTVIDQDYANRTTAPVSDTLRLELDLSDTSSGWLVNTVQVVESPSGFSPTPTTGTTPATTTTTPSSATTSSSAKKGAHG